MPAADLARRPRLDHARRDRRPAAGRADGLAGAARPRARSAPARTSSCTAARAASARSPSSWRTRPGPASPPRHGRPTSRWSAARRRARHRLRARGLRRRRPGVRRRRSTPSAATPSTGRSTCCGRAGGSSRCRPRRRRSGPGRPASRRSSSSSRPDRDELAALAALVDGDRLEVLVAAEYPLSAGRPAFESVREPGRRPGKTVLVVRDAVTARDAVVRLKTPPTRPAGSARRTAPGAGPGGLAMTEPIPVVFIHGLWLHATSWQPWVELFTRARLRAGRTRPGRARPTTVAATRADPDAVADRGRRGGHRALRQDRPRPARAARPRRALVRRADRGEAARPGARGRAPSPSTPRRSRASCRCRCRRCTRRCPCSRTRRTGTAPSRLTADEFRYAFGNAVDADESDALYDAWNVPSPGRPLFEAAAANFSLHAPTQGRDRQLRTAARCCSMMGGRDHTVPEAITKATLHQYRHSAAVTDLVEFGRPRTLADHRPRLARDRDLLPGLARRPGAVSRRIAVVPAGAHCLRAVARWVDADPRRSTGGPAHVPHHGRTGSRSPRSDVPGRAREIDQVARWCATCRIAVARWW